MFLCVLVHLRSSHLIPIFIQFTHPFILSLYSFLLQYSWYSAKALATAQFGPAGSASAEHSLVKRELVHMLLQWALANDEVGRLLDAVLDNEVA